MDDKVEAWIARMECSSPNAKAPSVLREIARLARRGMRAEREVCGTCEHMEPASSGVGHYCYMVSNKVTAIDFCSSWYHAREQKGTP